MTIKYRRVDLSDDDPIVTTTTPHTEYHRNGMCFRTDEYGRTVEVIVENLGYGDAPRHQLPRQLTGDEPSATITYYPDSNTVILDNDPTVTFDPDDILSTHNGHIVANHLGGPADAFNIVPQTVHSNLKTYKEDVENPVDDVIDDNPDTKLSAVYRMTYSNDVDAIDFYAPRDFYADIYEADSVADGAFDDVEPIDSFHHRHLYDPDLHDIDDDIDDVTW